MYCSANFKKKNNSCMWYEEMRRWSQKNIRVVKWMIVVISSFLLFATNNKILQDTFDRLYHTVNNTFCSLGIIVLLVVIASVLLKLLTVSQKINIVLCVIPVTLYLALNTVGNIYLFFIPYLFQVAILLSLILKFRSSKKSLAIAKDNIESKPFLEDTPLNNISEDNFKRAELAKIIADKISITNPKNGSFNIAVCGKWGSGKSSFLKLIELEIDKTPNDYFVVNYDPWKNLDAKLIPADFIDNIYHAVHKAGSSQVLRRSLTSYLSHLNNSGLHKKVSWFLSMINPTSKSMSELIKDIGNALVQEGKKLIIIIDDLDRLTAKEINQILILIRNTAHFKNTFYITGMDLEYVNEAVKEINNYSYEKYIDKIIDYRVDLPKYENNLYSELLEKCNVKVNTYSDSIKDQQSELAKLVKNKRIVNRVYNGFIIAKNILGSDVDDLSLLKLEILRYCNPKLYNWLSENYKSFNLTCEKNRNNAVDERQIKSIEKLNVLDAYVCYRVLKNIWMTNSEFNSYADVNKSFSKMPLIYFLYRNLDKNINQDDFDECITGKDIRISYAKIDEWFEMGKEWDLRNKIFGLSSATYLDSKEKWFNALIVVLYLYQKPSELSGDNEFLTNLLRRSDFKPLFSEATMELFSKKSKPPFVFESRCLLTLTKTGSLSKLGLDIISNYIIEFPENMLDSKFGYFQELLKYCYELYTFAESQAEITIKNKVAAMLANKPREVLKAFMFIVENKFFPDLPLIDFIFDSSDNLMIFIKDKSLLNSKEIDELIKLFEYDKMFRKDKSFIMQGYEPISQSLDFLKQPYRLS